MATEFKKLGEVEQVESASDNATVLVEEDGDIKRVPKRNLGGASSWNDLTDKPFDVKTEMVEILPEQSVAKETDAGGYWRAYITKANANSVIKDGEEYTVVFNGESESFVVDDGEMEKRDSFLIEIDEDGINIEWNKDFGETITLAIYEEQEVVKKLDPKFVTTIFYHGDDEYLYRDEACTQKITFEELDAVKTTPIVISTYDEHENTHFCVTAVRMDKDMGVGQVVYVIPEDAGWLGGSRSLYTEEYEGNIGPM